MRAYKKIYAVDFDGTLAETKFPEIIKPNWSMFFTCKMIKARGDILILWTCRCGEDLTAAVEFCKKHGLEFDYINENVPENVEKFGNDSRKIFAHEYIDDKAWSPKAMRDASRLYRRAIRRINHRFLKERLKRMKKGANEHGKNGGM
ncbi:hypothetical protein [Faecalicatena faecalis]|uniref:hypothetical protein n=1 Tax=Faecalicatena faecalis TaxID=2726362 RepID=UPI001FE9E22A|nr:hypothetical protein [Faecalicatena faecalis]